MSHRRRLALWVVGIVVASAAAAVILPGHRQTSVSAGVMLVLAVFLVEMGRVAYRVASDAESAWSRVRQVPVTRTERPADLERIERRLGWGQYAAGDFNYRVRPMLRRLAVARLAEGHRIDMDHDTAAARAAVSRELWDQVITKQPAESGHVITSADIARLVDEIEAL